jgi:hypothetical protein
MLNKKIEINILYINYYSKMNNECNDFDINVLKKNCIYAIDIMDFAERTIMNYNRYIHKNKIVEDGYVKTFTNLIVKSLEEYTVNDKPFHNICGIIYIKHNGKWLIEYPTNSPILDEAIAKISDGVSKKILDNLTDIEPTEANQT